MDVLLVLFRSRMFFFLQCSFERGANNKTRPKKSSTNPGEKNFLRQYPVMVVTWTSKVPWGRGNPTSSPILIQPQTPPPQKKNIKPTWNLQLGKGLPTHSSNRLVNNTWSVLEKHHRFGTKDHIASTRFIMQTATLTAFQLSLGGQEAFFLPTPVIQVRTVSFR